MRISPRHHCHLFRPAFSLLELLVVISIIGILAALMYPAVTGAMKRVKKSRAHNTAISLRNAIHTYTTEYGKLPVKSDSSTPPEIELFSNQQLMDVLCASPSSAGEEGLNPRRIVFYSGRNARRMGEGKFHSGVRIDADGSAELFDSWGEHYRVILDGDANGRIDKPTWDRKNPSHELTSAILVWSPGPDQKDEGEEEDNLKSW